MEPKRSVLEFSALSTVLLAHDLQNLLAIMAGCVDSLGGRTHLGYADRDFAELNEAIDSAFRLSRELIAAVGLQQPADPPIIDVHELLARYQGMLQRLVGEGVRLVVISTDASPALVKATPAQIEWILLNLAANGRDAMPDGGVLHLETARVERWSGPREAPIRGERYLRLTIRDEGRGVGGDVVASVFEPFFTTRPHGAGLGLTSVAVTVRALDGWLYIESPEQTGTSVHVLLPMHAETGDSATTAGSSG